MTRVSGALKRWMAAAVCAIAVTACVGHVIEDGDEPASVGSASLLDLDPSGEVAAHVWMDAPRSCDGRLESIEDWSIHYAEGAPSLGVVVDENGDPVCVDTWAHIRAELQRAMGDPSPDPMLPVLDEAMP